MKRRLLFLILTLSIVFVLQERVIAKTDEEVQDISLLGCSGYEVCLDPGDGGGGGTDPFDSAIPITLSNNGVNVNGITTNYEKDYYYFTIPYSGRISIRVTGSVSTHYSLYKVILAGEYFIDEQNNNNPINLNVNSSAKYYLLVQNNNKGVSNSYNISISFDDDITLDNPHVLSASNSSYSSKINYIGDVDYYKISGQGNFVKLYSNTSLQATLYDSSDRSLITSTNISSSTGKLVFSLEKDKVYYVKITGSTKAYTLYLSDNIGKEIIDDLGNYWSDAIIYTVKDASHTAFSGNVTIDDYIYLENTDVANIISRLYRETTTEQAFKWAITTSLAPYPGLNILAIPLSIVYLADSQVRQAIADSIDDAITKAERGIYIHINYDIASESGRLYYHDIEADSWDQSRIQSVPNGFGIVFSSNRYEE